MTATITDPDGLYNMTGTVFTIVYEDGNIVQSNPLTEGTGSNINRFTGSFTIPANPDGQTHVFTVTLQATDGNVTTPVVHASGSCTQAARTASLAGSFTPSTFPAPGGMLTVTATITDPDGLYNMTGTVFTIVYEDGNIVQSNPLTEGTGSNINRFTGSFTIPANPDGQTHVFTVTLQATDGNVTTPVVHASGSCTQAARTASVSGSISPPTLTAAGGTLNVTATINDPSGLYNGTGNVEAEVFDNGNLVQSSPLTEGTGSSISQFTGSFPIPANTNADCHLYTVTLQATDGNVTTPVVNAAGTCTVAPGAPLPVPTLSGITPGVVPPGSPDTAITLTGTNFTHCTYVKLVNTATNMATYIPATTFISTTQVTALVPAALLATPVSYLLSALNPAPGGGQSNSLPFVVGTGSLTGSGVLTTTATTVNLTTVGTTDWAHFARGGYPAYDHKATGGGTITNYTVVGSGTVTVNTNDLLTCSWTNGTPTSSYSSKSAVQVSGTGDGFQITAPADTSARTLTVYVGGANSGGQLRASLGDKSASDYVQTRSVTTGAYDAAYTITYHAASAGQKLYVKWTQAAGTGSVSLAAALH